MKNFDTEKRARFVMFLGLAILFVVMIFYKPIANELGDGRWIIQDRWLHGIGAALLLVGAWKWMDAKRELSEA